MLHGNVCEINHLRRNGPLLHSSSPPGSTPEPGFQLLLFTSFSPTPNLPVRLAFSVSGNDKLIAFRLKKTCVDPQVKGERRIVHRSDGSTGIRALSEWSDPTRAGHLSARSFYFCCNSGKQLCHVFPQSGGPKTDDFTIDFDFLGRAINKCQGIGIIDEGMQ